MKIVLFALNGSWVHTSLSIRCLRRPLEDAGFEVVLSEHTLRDRTAHVLEELYAQRADVYGFSCYIWNIEEMLTLARDLRALLPSTRIIFGGPEASFGVDRFDGMEEIDAIVCGEGEEAMVSLCQRMQNGEPFDRIIYAKNSGSLMQNEGVLYREGEGSGGILYYESSRGCPFGCAYCLSSAMHGLRQKSVEQTLADLEEFERIHTDCKVIKFVDRTFNADIKRANKIWQALLEERFTKHYHFEVCASLLNEESFEILAAMPKGKIQLEFGLQSTNRQTLEAVSRHIYPEKTLENVAKIHKMGNIHVHLDLIAGLPYEGYERFGRSFDDAYGCCDLLQVGFLKLLHGTVLREKMQEYGYIAQTKAPYTVMQSKWISYPEMRRLSHMAETLERYRESGKFVHTLWYLARLVPSQFAFWTGLTEYLRTHDERPLQKISQPDAYRYLMEYAQNAVEGIDQDTLLEMLAADFRESEHKNPPYFLK
ncbi:MAG: DUF4080 domain-containing protein [Clostridia bacterium]|nr:DUF4080 domain-containing protein [Clostridia bacterium]